MTWDSLLSEMRCPRVEGEEPAGAEREAFRSAFEVDYDRIVFSTPFRRLARKTQVHPLALNDQVHTRLTHSFEVASVGRSLAGRLARFLAKRGEMPAGISEQDLFWIVQAACLAHDIGNPPFGHAGEFAIREWVKTHPEEVFGKEAEAVGAAVRRDWEWFDGNAQGFRIAARGDNPQAAYLRLTFATLGAMIKYPWDAGDSRAAANGKFNVFSTEKELFEELAGRMGMQRGDGKFARHPLSFLSEAADDICYRILDLEDAVEMEILEEKRVREIYGAISGPADWPEAPLAVLRGKAIQALIHGMWTVFEKDYAAVMRGDREKDLKADLEPRLVEAVGTINRMYAEIFADRTKVAAELGAYKSLGRIIKAVCQATRKLSEMHRFKETGFLARRCLQLAWGEAYAVKHERQPYEWWQHQVIDYVSGLTDNYARQLSREIEGT